MKKKLSKIFDSLKKFFKKVFTKRVLLIVFLPIILLSALYLSRSLIFAAWVNGKPVYRYSLTRELEKQGGQQVLDALIEKALISSEAKKNSITISQSDVDAEIKKIEEAVTAQGLSLDEALKFRNMTKKNLVDQIKSQKIVEKLLSSKIVITDAEAKEYFTANKSLFGTNPVFDKVKDQVNSQLFQQKLSEEYTTWITDLKAKAKILYFVTL
jgi:parvulin-like peptidyl-prolyl isomerase